MRVAININGERTDANNANKEDKYFCPICGGSVIFRRGKINTDHFAHRMDECTDKWHYDMSEWHLSMQSRFPEDQREKVLKHKGEIHRADILSGKQIIEFQHSPISVDELIQRNDFYIGAGYQIAWVFDVQDQYEAGAISFHNSKNPKGLDKNMFAWSNPKRFLRCLPKPTEHNNKLVVFLYWIDIDGCENFNRVIWSTTQDGDPDFKKFIVADEVLSSEDNESKLSVEEFFITKEDMLKSRLLEIKHQYVIKYSGVRGRRREDYVCPRTNIFGIKQFGENACRYCRHCAAIKLNINGFQSYCCYPNQINEVVQFDKDYESSGIPVY